MSKEEEITKIRKRIGRVKKERENRLNCPIRRARKCRYELKLRSFRGRESKLQLFKYGIHQF